LAQASGKAAPTTKTRHGLRAIIAELRLRRGQESREAYDKAIELAGNTAETAYLTAAATSWGSRDPNRNAREATSWCRAEP
jgi:predicted RNA polymerase sigma factor